MCPRFATHATFVADTNFVSWTHKMFLNIFRNISCVRAARNTVATFCHGRATSQDTMCPPQYVLVLPGPKSSFERQRAKHNWERNCKRRRQSFRLSSWLCMERGRGFETLITVLPANTAVYYAHCCCVIRTSLCCVCMLLRRLFNRT